MSYPYCLLPAKPETGALFNYYEGMLDLPSNSYVLRGAGGSFQGDGGLHRGQFKSHDYQDGTALLSASECAAALQLTYLFFLMLET